MSCARAPAEITRLARVCYTVGYIKKTVRWLFMIFKRIFRGECPVVVVVQYRLTKESRED